MTIELTDSEMLRELNPVVIWLLGALAREIGDDPQLRDVLVALETTRVMRMVMFGKPNEDYRAAAIKAIQGLNQNSDGVAP